MYFVHSLFVVEFVEASDLPNFGHIFNLIFYTPIRYVLTVRTILSCCIS